MLTTKHAGSGINSNKGENKNSVTDHVVTIGCKDFRSVFFFRTKKCIGIKFWECETVLLCFSCLNWEAKQTSSGWVFFTF